MPSYLNPGVYFELLKAPSQALMASPRAIRGERASRNRALRKRPDWIAEHSTTAFVGLAAEGPLNTPIFVEDWRQFASQFGEEAEDSFLPMAVEGFFLNGGRGCYVVRIRGGNDEAQPTYDDFVGEPGRSGIGALEAIDDISLVCVPDVMAGYQYGWLDKEASIAVQQAAVAHCEAMTERFAILDTPPGMNARQVSEWRWDVMGVDSSWAALYYPWLRVFDQARGIRDVPPSGHIAGVFARSDESVGPHRNPANEIVRGALGLEEHLLLEELGNLHMAGINSIVASPGRGLRVWGARTLSSDPDWRYVRKMRLVAFISRNVRRATEWVIFKPVRDAQLWSAVTEDIEELLMLLWRSGALYGAEPDNAFSVRCDERTNPPEISDANQIVAEGVIATEESTFVGFRVLYWGD